MHMKIQYLPVSWDQYHSLTLKMAAAMLGHEQKPFDEIVAIARGGLTLGHLFSDYLQIPISSITIQSYTDIQQQGDVKITAGLSKIIKDKRILLVDDIADTGKTLVRATEYLQDFSPTSITTATMFYKPHCSVMPDYFAKQTDKWILLPFEVTEWIYTFTKKMTTEGKSKRDIQQFLESLGYTKSQILFVRRHHLL
jgi:hypoxanthine phosphoribosyltransferase